MARLLIVDDQRELTDRFSAWAAERPLEVRVANSCIDAVRIGTEYRPDIATVDFDIDATGNGNYVGRELKAIQPGIRMAGVTYGDPRNFDEGLFAVRASKGSKESYLRVLDQLMGRAAPEPRSGEYAERLLALSILLQGYDVAQRLIRGEQPVPGITLPVPTPEATAALLDVTQVGMTTTQLVEAFGETASDTDVQALLEQISSGTPVDTALAARVERTIQEMLR